MGIENIKEREYRLAKDRGDFFTRWLGLPLSLPITRFFLKFDISENTATFIMWLIGMIGSLLLLAGLAGKIVGLILLIFHYIFDYVDGQLARERKTASVLGAVKDRWSHFTVQMSFFFCLGASTYIEFENPLTLIPACILLFWHHFRALIANMSSLIYCSELKGYPDEERLTIYKNYKESISAPPTETHENPETQQAIKESLLSRFRHTSTNFNFLTFTLLFFAICEYLLIYLGYDHPLFFGGTILFAVYYLLNFIDYSKDYLFSDRISQELSNHESKLND